MSVILFYFPVIIYKHTTAQRCTVCVLISWDTVLPQSIILRKTNVWFRIPERWGEPNQMNNEGYSGQYKSSDRYWWFHTKYTHIMVSNASIYRYVLNVSQFFKYQMSEKPRIVLYTVQSTSIYRGPSGM